MLNNSCVLYVISDPPKELSNYVYRSDPHKYFFLFILLLFLPQHNKDCLFCFAKYCGCFCLTCEISSKMSSLWGYIICPSYRVGKIIV